MNALQAEVLRDISRQVCGLQSLFCVVEPSHFGWLLCRFPNGLMPGGDGVRVPMRLVSGERVIVVCYTYSEEACLPMDADGPIERWGYDYLDDDWDGEDWKQN